MRMNSSIMSEILNYYSSYYKTDNNYISINDDRIGRIVSFKLYINDDNEILADFYEARKIYPNNIKNYKTKVINSLEDFKEKWMDYYNS